MAWRDISVLFFDVFGTVVDWRSSVTTGLIAAAKDALDSASASIPSSVRVRASTMSELDWGRFAQQWRDSYSSYVQSRAKDATLEVKTIDEHHREALEHLLGQWSLTGLWTTEELALVNLLWHKLVPWPDSVQGIQLLNRRYATCTLSNGNTSLLDDLQTFGRLGFTHICSAEEFGTFKPNPAVYLGAAKKLKVQPGQCALVAAHLNDLRAARECGFATVYVERSQEEAWDQVQVEQAKAEGWVDVWITADSGFIAVAKEIAS